MKKGRQRCQDGLNSEIGHRPSGNKTAAPRVFPQALETDTKQKTGGGEEKRRRRKKGGQSKNGSTPLGLDE